MSLLSFIADLPPGCKLTFAQEAKTGPGSHVVVSLQFVLSTDPVPYCPVLSYETQLTSAAIGAALKRAHQEMTCIIDMGETKWMANQVAIAAAKNGESDVG